MFQKIKIFKPIHVVVVGIIAVVLMFAIYKKKNVSLEIPEYFIFKASD